MMRDVERLRYGVLAAQREGNLWLARQLKTLHLTPSQAEVLRVLGEREPLSLGELGALLVCESGTNPSRLVDRLVRAGLVARERDHRNGRQLLLSLSPSGRVAESAVRAVEQQLYAELEAATTGVDLAPTLALLAGLVQGSETGDALQRRGL